MPDPTQKPYRVPCENYQGTELKPDPSIPTARMYAFTLPSRMGDWLYYRDGRRVPFPHAQSSTCA